MRNVGLINQSIITLRVSRRRREMYSSHARLSVCLSAAACPHYCTDPDVTWGMVADTLPLVVQLLDGFAIGAWVALLWQHSANAKCRRVLVLALCLVGLLKQLTNRNR